MNRQIADLFARLNNVLFVLVVGISILLLFIGIKGLGARGGMGGIGTLLLVPLTGGIFAVVLCGLSSVMVEIMRSLRNLEKQSADFLTPKVQARKSRDNFPPPSQRKSNLKADRNEPEFNSEPEKPSSAS